MGVEHSASPFGVSVLAVAMPVAHRPKLIDAQGHQDGESTDTDCAGLPDNALRLVLKRGGTKRDVAVPAGTPRDAVFEVRW